MRQQNLWLTVEYKRMSDAFASDPNISPQALAEMFPRHTEKSINQKWVELGLTRPEGAKRHKPAWAAIAELLAKRSRTKQELADEMGCTRANIQMVMATMRAHWRIVGYQPSGHYAVMTPIVGLGAGEDAPYPKKTRNKKAPNPFAAAAGLVSIPQGRTGRIFQQPMDVKDEEEMAA
jgi:hypothetical protein